MPLRIANARTDRIAVDFAGVTPESIASRSLDAVRRTPVRHGNRRVELGELFAIDGDPRDRTWRLDGDFSAVHWLGADMAAGEIFVDGPLGRHAGSGMRGGRLEVRGPAGDWLGAEMRGGAIRVRGDAGDFVGAAYAGSPRGMTGGTILVDGCAGRELGGRMRRGLIAAAGDVGDLPGLRMLAGTIVAFGRAGAHPGASMRRGTIGLFGGDPPALLPTFRRACRMALPMLNLIARLLHDEAFARSALARLAQPVDLYHGDLLELGRGEILLARPPCEA
jgi:formylmethanofuran dehydrogenase subunit C